MPEGIAGEAIAGAGHTGGALVAAGLAFESTVLEVSGNARARAA